MAKTSNNHTATSTIDQLWWALWKTNPSPPWQQIKRLEVSRKMPRGAALGRNWYLKREGRRPHCRLGGSPVGKGSEAGSSRTGTRTSARQGDSQESGAGDSDPECGHRKEHVRQSIAGHIESLGLTHPPVTEGVAWSRALQDKPTRQRWARAARTQARQDCRWEKTILPQKRVSLGRIPETILECLPLRVKFLIGLHVHVGLCYTKIPQITTRQFESWTC